MSAELSNQATFPLLPLRDVVVYPLIVQPLFVGRPKSIKALEVAMSADKQVLLVAQKNPNEDEPSLDDLFSIGTVATILQLVRLPDGTVKVLVEGLDRAKISNVDFEENYFKVETDILPTEDMPEKESAVLIRSLLSQFDQYVQLSKKIPPEVMTSISSIDEPGRLVDTIASHMSLQLQEKQNLLELASLQPRIEHLMALIGAEIDLFQVEKRIRGRVKKQMEKSQREYYLNEQMKAIQKEMGELEDVPSEAEELRQRIDEAGMSKEAKEKASSELNKLKLMSPMSSEANVVRNYLEWLVSMPWQVRTEDNFDLKQAEKILDDDHYGLEKVIERIVEYMAVASLKGKLKGPILCLTGPPGVGKTSLAKSVARALGRNFVRISLGGVRDEAEIRGHRRTYIGAMPGKIIQSIKKAKSTNPVLLIDEIDKLYQSNISDPSAAMLEVLDPEQNNTFVDHYLDVEYSLADVLFICTANSVQNITGPLLDRMEVIHLSGYTELEKQHIATQFLTPRQRKFHGLDEKQLRFRKSAIEKITQGYTREAGVRNLEREIGKVCRKIVTRLVRTKEKKTTIVTPKLVHELLGVPQFHHDQREEKNEVGVSMGLGVTSMGGELLLIEVGLMSGSGKVVLTGTLGDVMQESAKAAFSYVRSNAEYLGIDPEIFSKTDLHVHLPEGATPKDGPSAGLPVMMAIISSFTKISVRYDVAMTGEITLRGHVTEIGGLKEKLIAAKRGLIQTVLIPEENEKDLVEIPDEIKKGLKIKAVKNVKESLGLALEAHPKFVKDQQKIVPDISWNNKAEVQHPA